MSASYHSRVMNIPTVFPRHLGPEDGMRLFHEGHKQARDAAAEIANEADATIAELQASLSGMLDSFDLAKDILPDKSLAKGVLLGSFMSEPEKARELLDRLAKEEA